MLDTTNTPHSQDMPAGSGSADILTQARDSVDPLEDITSLAHRSSGTNCKETSSQEQFPAMPKLGTRKKRKGRRGKEDYYYPSNRDCREAYKFIAEAKPDLHKRHRVSLPEDCYLFLQALSIRSRLDVADILVGLIKKAVTWNTLEEEYHARKKL